MGSVEGGALDIQPQIAHEMRTDLVHVLTIESLNFII